MASEGGLLAISWPDGRPSHRGDGHRDGQTLFWPQGLGSFPTQGRREASPLGRGSSKMRLRPYPIWVAGSKFAPRF
jgi:hypothetical protein